MAEIGIESPRSAIATRSKKLVLPSRPPVFQRLSAVLTLGGTGGGIAYNKEEFEQIVSGGLEASQPRKC